MKAQLIADAGPWVLTAAVALMLLFEMVSPLVPVLPARPRARHAVRNIALGLCVGGFVIGGTFLQVRIAFWADEHDIGLLHLFSLPWPVRLGLTLVLLDLVEYARHRAHHHVPLLWRLHRVHHSDSHLDATTAVRGHPLESLLAYVLFAFFVVVLGIDALSLAVRGLVVAVALAWHHSLLRLPERLDRWISLVTPTPRTHRMHHSRTVTFTDSNFGTLFTWWDRLFHTFSKPLPAPEVRTGLDGLDEPQQQSLVGLLRLPFERAPLSPKRAWG